MVVHDKRIALLFALLILSVHVMLGANRVRVALFEIRPIGTSEIYSNKVYSELRFALAQSRKILLISGQKAELVKKLDEWKKSGCTEVECMANAGIELGVDKIISGEIREMPGGYYELELVVVDVLSGEIDFVIPAIKEENVARFSIIAKKAVDAIEAKITIEPTVHSISSDGMVIIDAGADFGIRKGLKYSLERWANVQRDERGKIVFVDKKVVGEIEIEEVQASGSKAKVLRQTIPFEQGDKAIPLERYEEVDEPPVIVHNPVQASVAGKKLTVFANIIDDKRVEKANVYYRNKGSESFQSVPMTIQGKDKYVAEIPAEEIRAKEIEYYIKAVDSKGSEAERKDVQGNPFRVIVMADIEPPEIEYVPLASINASENPVIRVIAKDNVRVARVVLSARKSAGAKVYQQEFQWQGGVAYSGMLPPEVFDGATNVQYAITAFDMQGNSKTVPSAGQYFNVNVYVLDITGPQIAHTPIKAFGASNQVTVAASVKDETGVAEVLLFYKFGSETNYESLPMTRGMNDIYSTSIEVTPDIAQSKLQYYIYSKDKKGNESVLPSVEDPFVAQPTMSFVEESNIDTDQPFLRHFVNQHTKRGLGYPEMVHADDNVGIANIVLYYRALTEGNFKSINLRPMGEGDYGEFIPGQMDGIAYYIVCSDFNQNKTFVGDAQNPIVIENGEQTSGEFRYVVGNKPDIGGTNIIFLKPNEWKGLNEIAARKNDPYVVKLLGKENSTAVEGVIKSSREIKSVLLDSLSASLVSLSLRESKKLGISGKGTRFSAILELPLKTNNVALRVIDIVGKVWTFDLVVERSILPSVFVQRISPKARIRVTNPAVPEGIDVLDLSGVGDYLKLAGTVENAENSIQVYVNGQIARQTAGPNKEVLFESDVAMKDGANVIRIAAISSTRDSISRLLTMKAVKAVKRIVDNQPPTIEILSPRSLKSFYGKQFFSAKITDERKVDTAFVKNIRTGSMLRPKIRFDGKSQAFIEDTLELAQGDNTFEIQASDGINKTTKTFVLTYVLKKEPPKIFVIAPTDSVTKSEMVQLKFTVSDVAENNAVRIMLNNEPVQDEKLRGMKFISDQSKPVEITQSISLKPGPNVISITASNADSTVQKEIRLKYDYDEITGKSKYYALLIANEKYSDERIPLLAGPTKDADEFYKTLAQEYTFEKENIYYLRNSDRTTIIKTFADLRKKISPEDNLLVFFAGHGYWDEKLEQGYWLPSNANIDEPSMWLSNSDIRDNIKGVIAKHTLVISDACFAGGIFRTRAASTNANLSVRTLYSSPSRKAITSGNLKEVPDKSVFLHYLDLRLKENKEKYLSSEKLYYSIKEPVMNNSPMGQIPQYGVIQLAGDEGGDFIFVRKE